MLHLEFLINQSGNYINQYTGYQSNKLETATKMGGAITTVAITGVDGRGITPVSAIFQAPCQVPVTIFPHGYVQKHGNNYTTPHTAMGYTHLLTDGTANGSNSVLGSQAWAMGRSGNREFYVSVQKARTQALSTHCWRDVHRYSHSGEPRAGTFQKLQNTHLFCSSNFYEADAKQEKLEICAKISLGGYLSQNCCHSKI